MSHIYNTLLLQVKVGTDDFQFSVVSYGTVAEVEITLNQYHDRQELMDAVLAIRWRNSHTNTAAALQVTRTEAFSVVAGLSFTPHTHDTVFQYDKFSRHPFCPYSE